MNLNGDVARVFRVPLLRADVSSPFYYLLLLRMETGPRA